MEKSSLTLKLKDSFPHYQVSPLKLHVKMLFENKDEGVQNLIGKCYFFNRLKLGKRVPRFAKAAKVKQEVDLHT